MAIVERYVCGTDIKISIKLAFIRRSCVNWEKRKSFVWKNRIGLHTSSAHFVS